jgi:hypothetical protein
MVKFCTTPLYLDRVLLGCTFVDIRRFILEDGLSIVENDTGKVMGDVCGHKTLKACLVHCKGLPT